MASGSSAVFVEGGGRQAGAEVAGASGVVIVFRYKGRGFSG
jgi:hypothetical protein